MPLVAAGVCVGSDKVPLIYYVHPVHSWPAYVRRVATTTRYVDAFTFGSTRALFWCVHVCDRATVKMSHWRIAGSNWEFRPTCVIFQMKTLLSLHLSLRTVEKWNKKLMVDIFFQDYAFILYHSLLSARKNTTEIFQARTLLTNNFWK